MGKVSTYFIAAFSAIGIAGCAAGMPTGFTDAGGGFGYRMGGVDCTEILELERVSCDGLIEVYSPANCNALELDVNARYSSGQLVKLIEFPSRVVSADSISVYEPSAVMPEATRFTIERLSCMG